MRSTGRVGVRSVPHPLVIAFYGVGVFARRDEGNGGVKECRGRQLSPRVRRTLNLHAVLECATLFDLSGLRWCA